MKIVNTSKAMEKLSNLGITMECVSSDKMQTLKASCTANTDIKIVYCADYAEKTHLKKIAAIEKHIAHVKANITPVKKIECVYCADRADMQKKKKYHAYLEKMFNADSKATDPKAEKKSAVIPTSPERAKAISEKAKADYKKRVEMDKAIKTRKPEKLNEYSCNSNTLITSIDYTNTDLKEIERLKNKWSKIGLSNDTCDLLEKSKIESEVEKIKRKAVKRTNKNLVKHSNKSLKDITDNAKEIKARNEELTAIAKSMTSRMEYISYSKKFKKAFRNVVDIEYNENCLDVSAKLSSLHEKQKRLDAKRKALKIKISACDSVISQLTKTDPNKINYSLINSKLDIIGIGLTEYSLQEIQAVKTSINTTLTNVNAAIGNILDDIKALTNLETAYTKIKTGKEILIDVTTKELDKNIYFSVVVGYDIKENNSTYAILHIRQLAEKTLAKIGLNECIVDVNYNIFRNSDPDMKLALARQITKRQAYNMIARQGSKTQYQIYYACMHNDFSHHDTADIYSVAYTQILTCLSVKNPTTLLKVKNVLSALNAKIQHLNYTIDIDKIKKYVFTANNFLKYEINYTDILATRDYNKNKRLITLLENMYNAVKNKNVTVLKASVYNAINEYLTSIRSIRENDKITLNLDDYINRMSNTDYNSDNETLVTNPYADNDNAEIKRKILFECYKNVKKCINNSTAKTFDLMCKGYTEIQISEKRKMQKSTISEHISEIKKAFMQSYITLTKSDNTEIKQAFKNNVIVFDPSVFDDCKAISEKTEKIIDTYNKNIEVDKIKNAVGEMSAVKYADMQNAFITFVKSELRDIDIQIFSLLNDDTSVRDTAEKLSINMNVVKRTRIKIINKTLDIIERYAEITINRDSLKKVEFSTIIELIKTA